MDMDAKLNTAHIECPACDSADVTTEFIEHPFHYGVGDDAVTLSCILPLRICNACGDRFIDAVGESVRHDAVCRHLGIMTPREIQELRLRFGLTQSAMSELTGIGVASLSRWECGASQQSMALNNYMFLIGFQDNLDRLRERSARQENDADLESLQRRFRTVEITRGRLSRSKGFSLRPAA
ncbi:MAG: type II toxin-antitoxin system MqsA family antitoxin [Bryobacteraceae bacterium]